MIVRAKWYKPGVTGNVENFCGSVSLAFLAVAYLLLGVPECAGNLGLTPSLRAPGVRAPLADQSRLPLVGLLDDYKVPQTWQSCSLG